MRSGLLLFALASIACAGSETAVRDRPAGSAAFNDYFTPMDTVILNAGTDRPFVRLSGIDVGEDGRIVATDVSDGTGYLFSPQGDLVRTLGKRGFGPGEFQVPHTPRFGADGRIHVADARLQQIVVFSSDGRFERAVPLRGFLALPTYEVLPDGSYLLAGTRDPADPNVLFLADPRGTVLQGMLPLGRYHPAGQSASVTWQQIRRPSFTVMGDDVAVVLSIADSLWIASLRGGEQRATEIPIPGYKSPELPRTQRLDVREARAWGSSFTTVSGIFHVGESLLVSTVEGVMYEGDPRSAMLKTASGGWISLSGSPVLLGTSGDRLVTSQDPTADRITLIYYRLRER